MNYVLKQARYRLEAALLYSLFFFFGLMPPAMASGIGGFIGRSIGPRLAASRKAYRNLDLVFPDKSENEKKIIVRHMWENLGCVMAEYPHLESIAKHRLEVIGDDCLRAVVEREGPAIFIGGHTGNWELCGAALYAQYRRSLDLTYRAPNNPYVNGLLNRARTLNGKLGAYPKSRETARKLVKTMQDSGYLGIMIDQKFNTGLASLFLGQPAMTNPAPFQLAKKFNAPLIPALCERLPGCRFRMHILPALSTEGTVEEIMSAANEMLSRWIRDHPEQWLWIHRRWNSKALMRGR